MTDLVATACWPCVVGLHDECFQPAIQDGDLAGDFWQCCCFDSSDPDATAWADGEGVGRKVAAIEDVTSLLSTGRKRAEMMAPILSGMLCEWAGLRHAGGGVQPIVGCRGNRIADVKRNEDLPPDTDARGERHHGPDKNTLNNTPGQNLHRVCAPCHKHWHALNDPFYGERDPDPAKPFLPTLPVAKHDPLTQASEEELALSEDWWKIRTEQRPPYPFAAADPVR